MKDRRWAVRLSILALLLAAVLPLAVVASTHCYEVGNCTICDFWNGTTYAGFMRWCRPAY